MIQSSLFDNVPKAQDILTNDEMRNELLQIMIQTLDDFGYSKTADSLKEESSVKIEDDNLQELRKNILQGQWQTVHQVIDRIELEPEKRDRAKNLVNEQIYIELVASKNVQEALSVLREKLTKGMVNSERLHKLANLIICKTPEELNRMLGFTFSVSESRKNLIIDIQEKCQLSRMINSKRMGMLLHQSLCFQLLNSKYYVPGKKISMNLIEDFVCKEDPLPSKPIQTLKQHEDEIWIVKFSNNGNHIASIGKNHDMIIWEFDNTLLKATLKFKRDKIHDKEINSLYWSPDDKKILTASSDFRIKIWDVATGDLKNSVPGHTDIVCSAVWISDSEHFVSGGIDNSIFLWNLKGEQLYQLKAARITDLLISDDGRMLLAVSASTSKITIIDVEKKIELHHIQERDLIVSAACSSDSKFLLVNTSHKFPELHLWSLENFKLVQRYSGHVQEKYIIRCCFGGENDSYIACGGEDGVINIWHRNLSEPIKKLFGHTLSVNSVNWHPKNHNILVSASDDNSIKIWASDEIAAKRENQIEVEEDKNGDINEIMLEESDEILQDDLE